METKWYLIILVTIIVVAIVLYLLLKKGQPNKALPTIEATKPFDEKVFIEKTIIKKNRKTRKGETIQKPPPIGKNKWLHDREDFGKMEPGISDNTDSKYKHKRGSD